MNLVIALRWHSQVCLHELFCGEETSGACGRVDNV